MNIPSLRETLCKPTFWQISGAATCIVGSIALITLGALGVQFHTLGFHYHLNNATVAMDLTKTAGLLIGGGALFGVGAFLLRKCYVQSKCPPDNTTSTARTVINKTRAIGRLSAAAGYLFGIILISAAIVYIALQSHHTLLNGQISYLVNKTIALAALAAIALGAFIFSWGILELAGTLSGKPIKHPL